MNYKEILDLDKVSIVQTKNILVKSGLRTGGYSVNPYAGCPHACMYCYVPHMKYKPDASLGRWGTFLCVKQWDPILPPIARNYVGERVIVGTATDPYNPLEPHFQRTRTFLEEFRDSGIKLSLITKSDLVTRDIDLLSDYNNCIVAFSINTLDERFKDEMDAAPSIAKRIEAMKACKDMGLITSCFISPVFPLLTEPLEIIEKVRDHCDSIWIDGLNLQEGNLGRVTGFISMEYSWAFRTYHKIYKEKDTSYWREESERIKEYARKNGMEYSTSKISAEHCPLGKPAIIDFLPRCYSR